MDYNLKEKKIVIAVKRQNGEWEIKIVETEQYESLVELSGQPIFPDVVAVQILELLSEKHEDALISASLKEFEIIEGDF